MFFPWKGRYVLLFIITTNIRDWRRTESDMSMEQSFRSLAFCILICFLTANFYKFIEIQQRNLWD